MYGENNAFITLTYDDEHLKSPKLDYTEFQNFMKRLRKTQPIDPETKIYDEFGNCIYEGDQYPIGYFCTGEYGDRLKRPHWHAILFNWRPPEFIEGPRGERIRDVAFKYANERGDKVYTSQTLAKAWGKGNSEFGSVTIHSANYCARYAAKKLTHGKDGTHDFEPISKKSSRHAIGKKWLEKYWNTDCFNQGYIMLEDGTQVPIPRYYEKWLKANHPESYSRYVTGIKNERSEAARKRAEKQEQEFQKIIWDRRERYKWLTYDMYPKSRNQVREIIKQEKFKQLQANLKL